MALLRLLVAVSLLLMTGCGATPLHRLAIGHNRQGVLHLAAGRLDAAEARFELALEYNRRFSEPWANLGLVAMRRGDFPVAARRLARATQLNPDFSQAWSGRGILALHRGNLEEARSFFERAVNIDPAFVDARFNLARILIQLGEPVQARIHLLRLVELEPVQPLVRAALANADYLAGRDSEAMDEASRALALDRGCSGAFLVRGLVLLRRGDYEGGARELREALRLGPSDLEARLQLAVALAFTGDDATAEQLISQVLRVSPRHARALFALGCIREAQGRLGQAEALFRRALAARRIPEANLKLARLLVRSGLREEARAHFEIFLRTAPRRLRRDVQSARSELISIGG